MRVSKADLVLQFLRHYIAENGYAPSLLEIAVGVGIAMPTVHDALSRLQRQGKVERRERVIRGIRLIEQAETESGI